MDITHKYVSRTQAELEARDYSSMNSAVVTVYKLDDGRYGNAIGVGAQPSAARAGCSAVAEFNSGNQVF